jgi:hypothetical protein
MRERRAEELVANGSTRGRRFGRDVDHRWAISLTTAIGVRRAARSSELEAGAAAAGGRGPETAGFRAERSA